MRPKTVIGVLAVALLFLGAYGFAQPAENENRRPPHPPHQPPHLNLPDLSEDQKKQIRGIDVAFAKATKSFHNTIGEKEAKLRTLTTQDLPNLEAIEGLIAEIGDLRTKVLQQRAASDQSIRALLNDEQKIAFDRHLMHPKPGPLHHGPVDRRGR